MEYREELNTSKKYKEQYLNEIEKLLDKLEEKAKLERTDFGKKIFHDQEKYRSEFRKLLGWPLTEEKDISVPAVYSDKLAAEKDMDICRMQLEVLEGLKVTGLLFRHKDHRKRPFIIVQHGGLGTPELISGIYGDTTNYNGMLERVFYQGANVFAPQLLLWAPEKYELPFQRETLDARLKNVGGSITALEVYGLTRILDYFETQEWVGNMGMVGLSYGGMYTLYTAAVDTRIKASLSCSFFCDSMHHIKTDWSYKDLEKSWGQAEIACLVYPRKLCLAMGDQDTLFDCRKSQAEYERIKEISEERASDWVTFNAFSGVHEFIKEDERIKEVVAYLEEVQGIAVE